MPPSIEPGPDAPHADAAPAFAVGDKAVYPGYGVAEIVGIEDREIVPGTTQKFYKLTVLGKDITLWVPMANVASVGLRALISGARVEEVYDVLRKRGEKISTATWNRRYREYMEKIRTGSLLEIATVLRDLYLLRGDKDLSYGERNMLDNARSLLIQELALAKNLDEAAVEAEIEALF
jgi:CarD family transcriptional regulator